MKVWVHDDFLISPHGEREKALAGNYRAIDHNGLLYNGICETEDPESVARIEQMTENKFSEVRTIYRRYIAEEVKETYIHSDVMIGTFTGILFLNPPEQCSGGTAFWKHREYGWEHHPTPHQLQAAGLENTDDLWKRIHQEGFDESKWELTEMVPMRFNRLILFWSPRYHSRYPQVSFGTNLNDARLIKVFFLKV